MDSAFPTAAYPGYTTDQLRTMALTSVNAPKMLAEIARRERVAAGDMSVATPGERLRHVQAQRKGA